MSDARLNSLDPNAASLCPQGSAWTGSSALTTQEAWPPLRAPEKGLGFAFQENQDFGAWHFIAFKERFFFSPYGNWNYTNRNSRSPSHLWILFHSCVQEQPGINLLKFYKTHRCNDPILPIKLTVEYPSGNKREGCLNSGRAVGAEGVCAWHVHCLSTFSQPLNREKFPGLIIIVIFPQPLN